MDDQSVWLTALLDLVYANFIHQKIPISSFRFAAALGKVLSELAIDGQTPCDISSFNITRRAIQDPNFKCTFDIGFTHSRL